MLFCPIGETTVDREPVSCESDRRRHHLRPRQPTELFVKLVQPGRRSRHTRGQWPDQRSSWTRFALLVEVHVASRLRRSGLAKIEGLHLVSEASDRKPAPAKVAGSRPDHRQREGRSHRRICGVPARPENLEAGLGGAGCGAGDRPARAPGRLRVCRIDDAGERKHKQQ